MDDLNRPRINQVNSTATENFVIRCPCLPDRPLIKESECNKLTCPNCKKLWCWYCKREITETEKPYNHFGPSKGLCALWDEPPTEDSAIDKLASASLPGAICDCSDQQKDGNLSMCKRCFKCACKICEETVLQSNPYHHFDKHGGKCRMKGHPADAYEQDALSGKASAQIEMGLIYQTGRDGVPIGFERAKDWFQMAVDNESEKIKGLACYHLGYLWIERAAALGHADASRLKELHAQVRKPDNPKKNDIPAFSFSPLKDSNTSFTNPTSSNVNFSIYGGPSKQSAFGSGFPVNVQGSTSQTPSSFGTPSTKPTGSLFSSLASVNTQGSSGAFSFVNSSAAVNNQGTSARTPFSFGAHKNPK